MIYVTNCFTLYILRVINEDINFDGIYVSENLGVYVFLKMTLLSYL